MLNTTGFIKKLKVYEIFEFFYFLHLVTSDGFEQPQLSFDPRFI